MAPPTPEKPASADVMKQVDAMKALTDAISMTNTSLEKLLGNMSKFSESTRVTVELANATQVLAAAQENNATTHDKVEKALDNTASTTQKQIKNIEKLTKSNKNNAKSLSALSTAIRAVGAAMKAAINVGAAFIDVLGSIAGMVKDVGLAILTAPFEMLDALMGQAKEMMGAGTEVAQALENIRGNFGDISKGLSKTVKDMGISMATGLITPGLQARRVFGSLAEALEEANAVAEASPATFQALRSEFENVGMQVLAMAKGLGMDKEELIGLQNAAISTGTSMSGILSEVTKYAKGMGAQFGLNSKMISRDMTRAMKDVKHFANVSVKELSQATVYAHKLGLELKDITGVLDAFNTFESAAENVSKLSQAFGVNIDAMKLLEAKTPDEALDQIKQAFTAAGKSADQMNRQELQLIAQTTNMSEEAVRQALSMKNAGVSMNSVKSASGKLEHQTLSTSQALKELADDIKRVVKAGEPPRGNSFFDIFFEGIEKGILTSRPMMKIFQNLGRDMIIVRDAGIKVGRMFVEMFPGVEKFLDAIGDFFSPAKFQASMNKVTDSFRTFFAGLKGGTTDLSTLFKDLWNSLSSIFDDDKSGRQLKSGFSEMWGTIKALVVKGIEWIGETLSKALTSVADALTKTDLTDAAESQALVAGKALSAGIGKAKEEVSPIGNALVNAFEKIKGPAERIFNDLLDRLIKIIEEKLSNPELWGRIWDKLLIALQKALEKLPALLALANPVTLISYSFEKGIAQAIINGFVNAAKRLIGDNPLTNLIPSFGGTPTPPPPAAGPLGTSKAEGMPPEENKGISAAKIATSSVTAAANLATGGLLNIAQGASGISGMLSSETKPAVPEPPPEKLEPPKEVQDYTTRIKEISSKSLEEKKKAFEEEIRRQEDIMKAENRGALATTILGSQNDRYLNAKSRLADSKKMLADLEKKLAEEATSKITDPAEIAAKKKSEEAIAQKQAEIEAEKARQAKREAMTKQMGLDDSQFNIDTAAEKVKKLQQLSTEIGKFDIETTLSKVRDKFKNVKDWELISKENRPKLENSAVDMTYVAQLFDKVAETLSHMRSAGNSAQQLGAVDNEGSLANHLQTGISSALTIVSDLVTKIENVTKIGALSTLSTQTGTINDTFGNVKGIFDALKGSIDASTELSKKAIPKNFNQTKTDLEGWTSNIEPLLGVIKTLTEKQAVVDLPKTKDSLDAMKNNIGEIANGLADISKTVVSFSATQVQERIKAMVDAMNQLNQTVDKIDVGANGEVHVKLNKLAKGINKADAKYVIEKKNAVIHLTVSVSMSATDIENMLIKNPNSIIRARFNDVGDKTTLGRLSSSGHEYVQPET